MNKITFQNEVIMKFSFLFNKKSIWKSFSLQNYKKLIIENNFNEWN
jgi:hypothetical protein